MMHIWKPFSLSRLPVQINKKRCMCFSYVFIAIEMSMKRYTHNIRTRD